MHKFLKRLNTPAPWWAWLLAVLLIPASITATPVLYTGSISVPTGGTFSSKATVVAYNNVQFRDTSNAAVTANGDLVLGLAGNAQGAPYFGCAGTAQNCTLNFYANGTGSVANEVFTPTSAYAINGAQWRATPGNTLNLAGDFVAGVSSTNQEYVGCTGTANPCTVAFYTNGTGSTSTASISGSNGAIFSSSFGLNQCVRANGSGVLATTGFDCQNSTPFPVYNPSGTAQTAHAVFGLLNYPTMTCSAESQCPSTVTLTFSGSAVFSNATSYTCFFTSGPNPGTGQFLTTIYTGSSGTTAIIAFNNPMSSSQSVSNGNFAVLCVGT